MVSAAATGVTIDTCVCRCWVAPVVHLLVKDAVLSDFLLSKDIFDEANRVQSQLLMLVDQFHKRSQAVDVEDLLDALALSFGESSRRLLSRLGADGQRKAVQTQLEWSEAAQFMLDALTSEFVSPADEVAFRTACFPHLPNTLILYGASSSCFCLHFPSFSLHGHPGNLLLADRLDFHVSVFGTELPFMWQHSVQGDEAARGPPAKLGASPGHPAEHVSGCRTRTVFLRHRLCHQLLKLQAGLCSGVYKALQAAGHSAHQHQKGQRGKPCGVPACLSVVLSV